MTSAYCKSGQYVGTSSNTKSNHTAKPVNIQHTAIITVEKRNAFVTNDLKNTASKTTRNIKSSKPGNIK